MKLGSNGLGPPSLAVHGEDDQAGIHSSGIVPGFCGSGAPLDLAVSELNWPVRLGANRQLFCRTQIEDEQGWNALPSMEREWNI